MPYKSDKQAAFVHAKAAEGVPWAQKFVQDAHGTHVSDAAPPKRKLKGKRKAAKSDPKEGSRADFLEDSRRSKK